MIPDPANWMPCRESLTHSRQGRYFTASASLTETLAISSTRELVRGGDPFAFGALRVVVPHVYSCRRVSLGSVRVISDS